MYCLYINYTAKQLWQLFQFKGGSTVVESYPAVVPIKCILSPQWDQMFKGHH